MVLQFDADALIGIRAVCPEFDVLHRLKPLAQRGIEVLGEDALSIGAKILKLHAVGHRGGLGLFLEILEDIEAAADKRLLASEHFISVYNQVSDRRHRRIDQAIQILQSNPAAQMQEVAELVGFEPSHSPAPSDA